MKIVWKYLDTENCFFGEVGTYNSDSEDTYKHIKDLALRVVCDDEGEWYALGIVDTSINERIHRILEAEVSSMSEYQQWLADNIEFIYVDDKLVYGNHS